MYYLYFIYAKMDINMKWKEMKIGMFRIRSWSRLTHNCRDVGSLASFKVKEGTERLPNLLDSATNESISMYSCPWRHFSQALQCRLEGSLGIFSAKKILLVYAEEPTRPLQVVTLRCNGIAQILDVNKPKTSLKKCMHTVSNFISFNLSNVGEYSGDKVEMRKDHIQV